MFQALLANCPTEVKEPEPTVNPVEVEQEEICPLDKDPLSFEYSLAFSDRIHRYFVYELILLPQYRSIHWATFRNGLRLIFHSYWFE